MLFEIDKTGMIKGIYTENEIGIYDGQQYKEGQITVASPDGTPKYFDITSIKGLSELYPEYFI